MSGNQAMEELRHGWPLIELPELLSKLATDSAPRRFAVCALDVDGDLLRDAEIVGWGLEYSYLDEDEKERTEAVIDLPEGGIARFQEADGVRRLFSKPDLVRLIWC
ncbi:hypothetical protein [Fodinicola acaciae]|uniref:hypothetical protein n=1 Tax=Fodinicola acaciae TaxID=2681555 RepID=UPI0013D5DC79|nr:hypothetical protein [Fodinicola acaciae]